MRPENLSWQDALQQLKNRNIGSAKSKQPYAIILSCSNCQTSPELIFNADIGEIVVIRVAGNTASSSIIASIEHAVMQFGVNLIIVLGHADCTTVKSAITGGDNGYHLNQLLAHILPAISISKDQSVNAVAKIHTNLTTASLAERSTFIRAARDEDGLKIIPAFYHSTIREIKFL